MANKKFHLISHETIKTIKSEIDKNLDNRGCYQSIILDAKPRVIVIGDIHGDLQLAINSFKLAKLIDDNYNWIANPLNTVVVQVGDLIDSCRPKPDNMCHYKKIQDDKHSDINVMNFFKTMDTNARKKGGAVYSLLGNHELLNVEGKFNYVSYDNYNNFEYTSPANKRYLHGEGRYNAFKIGGPIAQDFACTRPAILIIGKTLFCHAGLIPELHNSFNIIQSQLHYKIDHRQVIQIINDTIKKWLLNGIDKTTNQPLLNLLLNNEQISPLWTREYGLIYPALSSSTSICDDFNKTLETYNINSMVVGHTPQKLFFDGVGINDTCIGKDKRLYRVDGGFSRAFDIFSGNMLNNVVQVLEIINDYKFTVITN